MQKLVISLLFVLFPFSCAFAESKCSSSTLRGMYSFSFSGYRIIEGGIPLQFVSVGKLKVDDPSRLIVKETSSIHGAIVRRSYEGVLNLQEDCTGSVSFIVSATEVAHYDVVVTPDGNEIHFIQTDSGMVVRGTYKRDAGAEETVITPGTGVIGPPR